MSKSSSSAVVPVVKVSPRGASRLKDGHVWVYRSDIVSAAAVPPGSLVTVKDHRGQFLGAAHYSSSSQIAIRLLSREPVADFPALLRQRVDRSAGGAQRIGEDLYRALDRAAVFWGIDVDDVEHDAVERIGLRFYELERAGRRRGTSGMGHCVLLPYCCGDVAVLDDWL